MKKITAYLSEAEYESIQFIIPPGKSQSAWAKDVLMEKVMSNGLMAKVAQDYEYELVDGTRITEEGASPGEGYVRATGDIGFERLSRYRIKGGEWMMAPTKETV